MHLALGISGPGKAKISRFLGLLFWSTYLKRERMVSFSSSVFIYFHPVLVDAEKLRNNQLCTAFY